MTSSLKPDICGAHLKVRIAFSSYFKAERNRCEKALESIADIIGSDRSDEDMVIDILGVLESHYGRHGETGSLDAFAAAPEPKP